MAHRKQHFFFNKQIKIRAKSLPPPPSPTGRLHVCILH